MSNLWQKSISTIWKNYSNDVGKSLIHLGAIGWLFSSLAQIGMIASNKDINKKEKRFLIPQESADLVINVGLYYTICQIAKKLGDKVLESTNLITEKTSNILKLLKTTPIKNQKFVKNIAEEFRTSQIIERTPQKNNLSDFYNGFIKILENKIKGNESIIKENSIIKPLLEKLLQNNTQEEALNLLKSCNEEFLSFKNGLGVLTAVCASILACNIITPIARNMTANHYQKKSIEYNKKTIPAETKTPIQKIEPYQNTLSSNNVFQSFKI